MQIWGCCDRASWNRQDATNLVFIIKLLSQHVSGIIMPIFRRTWLCTTAYGVLHWVCWLWLCGAGTRAVRTAHPMQNTICGSTQSWCHWNFTLT